MMTFGEVLWTVSSRQKWQGNRDENKRAGLTGIRNPVQSPDYELIFMIKDSTTGQWHVITHTF